MALVDDKEEDGLSEVGGVTVKKHPVLLDNFAKRSLVYDALLLHNYVSADLLLSLMAKCITMFIANMKMPSTMKKVLVPQMALSSPRYFLAKSADTSLRKIRLPKTYPTVCITYCTRLIVAGYSISLIASAMTEIL